VRLDYTGVLKLNCLQVISYFPVLTEVIVNVKSVAVVKVYLVHSCGTEQRVTAELKPDNLDVTSGSEVSDAKVKVSIPVNYAMDVYVAARDNAASVGGITQP